MNLCLQEDLIREQAKWTYPSEQITIISDETDLEDLQSTIQDRSSKIGPKGAWVEPASPWGPLVSPRLYVSASPPLRINLNRVSRSVRIKSPDGSLPRIHGPTGCLVPSIKGPHTSSRRASLQSPISREIHQRSISRYTKRIRSRALQCSRLVAQE